MTAFLVNRLRWATAKRGNRLRDAGALICAFLLHVTLVLLMLSWRAPLALPGEGSAQVSLVALPGRVSNFAKMPNRRLAVPKLERVVEARKKATPVPQSAIEQGASIKMRSTLSPPADLEPILVDVSMGGSPPPSPEVLPTPSPSMQALAATQAGGKTCQIFEVLQTMLQTSDEVRRALPLIPASARSVANAVMLWDGRWVDDSTLGGPPTLGPIQSIALLAVTAAPPNCRAELVRGPRLITVGDARDTTVLAFGSGEWRWGDLLTSLHPPQSVKSPSR